MPCYELRGKKPRVSPDAWIAPTAILIGDVTVHAGASIWWGCVLRADNSPIEIGAGTNVQDNTVIHVDDSHPTIIGENVTIGHSALVHSSIIEANVLVGMCSVLVGQNKVGAGSIIGGGAVLSERFEAPARSLILGVPAKVVREVAQEYDKWTHDAAGRYQALARRFATELREVEPDPV